MSINKFFKRKEKEKVVILEDDDDDAAENEKGESLNPTGFFRVPRAWRGVG